MPSAARLFRVDLSSSATDFRCLATEPGLPLLDRAGSNYTILRRWLGRYLAEPQWVAGDSVNFYAQNGEGGRLSPTSCSPVEREDLVGPLKAEWETLRTKLRGIKPADKGERVLLDNARRAIEPLADPQKGLDPSYSLFKYREPGQPWRLLWCWGYQRADAQPATTVICTNPDCNVLFLRRPQSSGRCPGCAKAGAAGQRGAIPRRGRRLAALILLLLLAGGGAAAWSNRLLLEARPEKWEGPVGSRADLHVIARRWFFWTEDVTASARPLSHDTRVIEFASPGRVATARGPGSTLVSFFYGNHVANVETQVTPGEDVASLRIEPEKLSLAVGSTAQLKAVTEDTQGRAIDVSPAVQWELVDSTVATVRGGRLEALAPGKTWITARYSPDPEEDPLIAEGSLEVTPVDYRSLEVAPMSPSVEAGQIMSFTVTAKDAAGQPHDVTGASKLKIEISPPEVAKLDGSQVSAVAPGKAEIRAELGALKTSSAFEVGPVRSAADREFRVAPKEVTLAVGEHFKLDVLPVDESPITATSADPKVVETVGDRELVGRIAGESSIKLTQGAAEQTVHVRVKDVDVEALRIDPDSVSLSVGGKTRVRVMGRVADGREIEIAPSDLAWTRQPPSSQVDFDRGQLQLTGLAATDSPQELTAKYRELTASADVSVQGSPAATADDFAAYPPVLVDRIAGPPVGAQATVVDSGGPGLSADLGDGTVAGGRVAPDLVMRDGSVVVDAVAPRSALAEAGVPAGAVVLGVDGQSFEGMNPAAIRAYLNQHPLGAGRMLRYRAPGGKLVEARLGERLAFVQDVRLVSIKFHDVTDKSLTAECEVAVREPGEYRISDAQSAPLGDWRSLARESVAQLTATQVPRTPGDEYELYVDRKIGNETRRFQISFRLTSEQR